MSTLKNKPTYIVGQEHINDRFLTTTNINLQDCKQTKYHGRLAHKKQQCLIRHTALPNTQNIITGDQTSCQVVETHQTSQLLC
eukprot:m.145539 g.145539  ORF g.145539 m.145539 type:complete len:83 (+) comp30444_c0_seq6:329-577(+)